MVLPPAPAAADERLLYLQELTGSLVCDEGPWGDGSAAALERLAKALEEEMRPLVRDPYESQLAERIRTNLRWARGQIVPEKPGATPIAVSTPGFSRDFVVVPGNSPTRWGDRSVTWIVGIPQPPPQTRSVAAPRGNQPGNAVGVVGDFTTRPVGPPIVPVEPVVLRCRHGEPSACNLDQRDSQGETALGSAINRLKADEVKVLLAAGADPAVRTTPAGEPAIDVLLRRMARTSPNHGESDRALEILALLAAHPKVAIARRLKQDLATDPSRWESVRNTMGERLFVRARETLAALPERSDEVARCARLDPMGFDTTLRPFRLQ